MKKLLSLLFLTVLIIGFSACGNDEDDPTPTKTNLELVQEGIIGYWDLQSIEVKKIGEATVIFNGGCDESSLPAWAQANVGDLDFNFTSNTKVKQVINCPSTTEGEFTYLLSEPSTNVFQIKITNGMTFELLTEPKLIENSLFVEMKVTPLIQGATSAVWKFKRK